MNKITISNALERAVKAHREGKLEEADKYYTAILQAQPKHSDANHNIGVLAVGLGKVKEALPFFKTAVEANSKIGQYWLSYINALINLGELDEALLALGKYKKDSDEEKAFPTTLASQEKAIAIKNGFSNAYFTLGNALKDRRKLEQAIKSYEEAIAIRPDHAEAYCNMGNALSLKGESKAAIANYRQAINIKPDFALAYCNMGVDLHKNGNRDQAIESFSRAIEINPDFDEAYCNMGNALTVKGDLKAAIDNYRQAINVNPDYALAHCNMGINLHRIGNRDQAIESFSRAIEINPDFDEAYSNLGISLKETIFLRPAKGMPETILKLLERGNIVRPKDIIIAILSLLKFDPIISNSLNKYKEGNTGKNIERTCADLAKNPLLMKVMRTCPILDIEIEGLLTEIRSTTLLCVSEIVFKDEALEFISAVALQCFINEYLYDQTEEETQALTKLERAVEKKLLSGIQPSITEILILASYKTLHEYDWHHLLTIPDKYEELERRQVKEIQEEKDIQSSIPVLQEIKNETSLKVKNQYEDNPYPRWLDLGMNLNTQSLSEIIKEINLKIYDDKIKRLDAINVLIAGCGTGQHSIGASSRYNNCNITAVDLSLRSLAYARRKTNELGINNIEYMQADILDLVKLEQKFDIIESAGVLHHMEDPMEGWRVLVQCLKPGGLMRIGLYSNLARQHVLRTRDEVVRLGIGSDNISMKKFRSHIIKSEEDHHKRVMLTGDFYTISSLRDLLFHVQEQTFTIPKIDNSLSELGLEFCGFESVSILQKFMAENRDLDDLYNLKKWHDFEKNNPRTFGAMYVFWCQKVR